ncbi:MAG TPA: hypothetical protein VM554_13180 [Acidisarcina sp.]|nr:hypothetical protein [Acidisarcina sp.]
MGRSRRTLAGLRCMAVLGLGMLAILGGSKRAGAQAIEGFAWTNLHEETDRVAAVTKALDGEKYTALREIAVVGDEALVITATRPNPAARPDQDRYTAYSVGLKDDSGKPVQLMTGMNLRFRDWLRFVRDGNTELVATYDDCSDCRTTTFLTSFYLDPKTKKWRARWPREVAGAPFFSSTPGNSGETDQAYALMVGEDGRAVLATWSHFQQKRGVKGEDYLFEYDVDPATGLERSRPVVGTEAGPLKTRLCRAEGEVLEIAAGQDTASCAQIVRAAARRAPRHSARRRRVFTRPLVGESRPR